MLIQGALTPHTPAAPGLVNNILTINKIQKILGAKGAEDL